MNLLLLEAADFVAADRVRLSGRRLQHMLEIQRVSEGDSLRVGRIGGDMGTGKVLSLSDSHAELQLTLDQPPPPKLPVTLLLALLVIAVELGLVSWLGQRNQEALLQD